MSPDAPLDAQGPAPAAEPPPAALARPRGGDEAPVPPPLSRARRSRLIAAAALVSISVAGVVSYRSVRDELEALLATPADAPRPDRRHSSPGREPFAVARTRRLDLARPAGRTRRRRGERRSTGRGPGDSHRRRVHTQARRTVESGPPRPRDHPPGRFDRRARRDPGLAMRDELLDDAPPVGAGRASAEVSWLLPTDAKGWIEITSGNRPPTALFAKHALAVDRHHFQLDRLVAVAEALLRSELPRA